VTCIHNRNGFKELMLPEEEMNNKSRNKFVIILE